MRNTEKYAQASGPQAKVAWMPTTRARRHLSIGRTSTPPTESLAAANDMF